MKRHMESFELQSQRTRPQEDGQCKGADKAMYAINRVDADCNGQNAWLVHFSRGGKTFQMTFSDGTYGGNEQ